MKKTTQGFTLIELLVVASIIGLLSSIMLASLSSARQKAVNAATVAQVREYQKAMALFYADNGRYPIPGNPTGAVCLGPVGTTCIQQGVTLTNTNTAFLGELALIEGLNSNVAKDSLFKVAYAATLSTYIPLNAVKTPQVIYNNNIWSGASYMCEDVTCKEAQVYWPIKSTNSSNISNGDIKVQKADGGGSVTSY